MGISIWQLLIILLIVLLIFGAKKLRGLGTDLGGAVKGFRDSVRDEREDADFSAEDKATQADVKHLNQEAAQQPVGGEPLPQDKEKV